MKKIAIPKSFTIEVGLWNDFQYPNHQSVAQVGKWNKEGTDRIPQRDFFALCREEMRERTHEIFVNIVRKSNRKRDVSAEMDLVGIVASNILKQAITDLRTPPNAPSTIAKKKSSNPLIDTGFMRQSVDWRLRKNYE